MRISAIQKDILFVLYALRVRGNKGPVASTRLLSLINAHRGQEIHSSNFRISCHTMALHGLVVLSYSKSLKLLVGLGIDGNIIGSEIYDARLRELQDDATPSVGQTDIISA
ncbi:chromosome segregation protein ParM [Lelliottia amnigena]|jgi:hypothetical protein|uniref:chromosome segregation protein ParM n=1 Tax=Lelliottia TaxID=1330545 RepID=UPI00192A6EFC|nr:MULTISPECIES: chromosome segregation protein ParM [Lelliottia]MBL5885616.1 chromosome segregation protein ParM [Lelliottia aquatilis]MBL5923188.1 chromosome segregation protein ParM [Lelliottia amnigena]MBL5932104.1 chromosome segregation protein ParM [Lelliottia amnigena]